MRRTILGLLPFTLVFLLSGAASAEEIRMASGPDLSPDGANLAFAWRGDIWRVNSGGGEARRLTRHPADDREASFSPDGEWIAFTSDRFPGRQVYVMPAVGGTPRQITWDTNGYSLMGWFPDGESLLVRGRSDRAFTRDYRFYRVSVTERAAPVMLFDAYGITADVSRDGKKILFTREGVAWWRKGYTGSQASQIWLCDLETGEISPQILDARGARWPRFIRDDAYLFVGVRHGAFNLMLGTLGRGQGGVSLTDYEDDSVISPTVSRDGSTIVYRHLFDLYRRLDRVDTRITITAATDDATSDIERRMLNRADAAAFTGDGLEIAFVSGGELWVMDTVLREPKRLSDTIEEEREPLFLADASAILFVSDRNGQSDIWRIERTEPERWWWQSNAFRLTRITDDDAQESGLALSPDGKRISYIRGQGELVTADLDGSGVKVVARGSSGFDYDWSPDSSWLAYSSDDFDSNRDVWIVAADGEGEPVNVSRHPYEDWDPAWSPDGKILAFTGARRAEEVDIFYVYLREADEQKTKRDRTLSGALEKMAKARKTVKKPGAAEEKSKEKKEPPFDLEGIHERVRRISTRNVSERNLFWSPDGKKLAFEATINGKRGTYTATFPDSLGASLLTTTRGSGPRWVKQGNQILWLVGGSPASSVGSRTTTYGFRARLAVDREAHQAVAFDLAWRWMRDWFYDERMNNRDWNAIRVKYREAAAKAPDKSTFGRIVSLMLGELNASHLGFSVSRSVWRSPDQWSEVTAHLGVRFMRGHPGPGLRVETVIPDGPADHGGLSAGDVIHAIEDVSVGPGMDLTTLLNGAVGREVSLSVSDEDAAKRQVRIRPSTLAAMRGLLYREWVRGNRREVAKLSGGDLGYVHVAGMNWSSFDAFERGLYAEGFAKKGILIDVRFNGGGFTADHLLTVLTQPVHAIAVRRGGGPGYPQDRTIYARWTKPVTVLVNQASFSNAEIFAHAVKTIGRGRIVGVPSAGGVISTSGTRILDMGTLRLPLRGWFLANTGEDLERNGVQPDFVIWPEPGDFAQRRDAQLEKAVEVLLEDVSEWEARPRPKLRKASER